MLSFVREFKDLHLTQNFKAAKVELKGLSGIYCIKCLITEAVYIGSAVDLANRLENPVYLGSSRLAFL